MGKMLKLFKQEVPTGVLEKAEKLISGSPTPSQEESAAVTDMLNTVFMGFYLSNVDTNSRIPQWEQIARVNSAIEQGLREFPKCLIVFKTYVAIDIGKKVISVEDRFASDFSTARRLLYLDWYDDITAKAAEKGQHSG